MAIFCGIVLLLVGVIFAATAAARWPAAIGWALFGVFWFGVCTTPAELPQDIPGWEPATTTVREVTVMGKYSSPAVITTDGAVVSVREPIPAPGQTIPVWCRDGRCVGAGVEVRVGIPGGFTTTAGILALLGLVGAMAHGPLVRAALRRRVVKSAAAENTQLLARLREAVGDRRATIFGSSAKEGVFAYYHPQEWYGDLIFYSRADIDLMIEVDLPTWRRWAAAVYNGGEMPAVGDDLWVSPYGVSAPTRALRHEQLKAVLGIRLPITVDWDVFLFPHEFVRGEMDIPAWNDPRRSFRDEVLAGIPLATAETVQV